MLKLFSGAFIICSISCNQNSNGKINQVFIADTSKNKTIYPQESSGYPDTRRSAEFDSESSANTLQLIKSFSEKEFIDMREQLVVEGKEHNYDISPIKKLGQSLKFSVIIPGIEGKMNYSCTSEKGELSIIFIGDKEIAEIQFNQNKAGLRWDECNEIEAGTTCKTYQDMEEFPLKSHFIISLLNSPTSTIYSFTRTIMPK